MTSINFDKDEYIKNYRLTLREFYLMGEALELAYANKVCRNLIEKVPNVDDEVTITEFIPASRFSEYFRRNGCKIILNNHGAFGLTTTVKRINSSEFVPTTYAEQLLERYRLEVAETKAEIISELLSNYYETLDSNYSSNLERIEEIITTFESEVASQIYLGDELPVRDEERNIMDNFEGEPTLSKVNLSEEQLDRYIAAELSPQIREIEWGEVVEIKSSATLLKEYNEYLRKQNYEVIEEQGYSRVKKIYR